MSLKNEKQTSEVTSVTDIESASVRNKVFGYEDRLASTLNARHIGMISVVGVFGTGLFLSSGGSLATAGPVGILLCYFFVGLVVLASQMCAAETACLMPVTFATIKQSNHFI